MDEVLNQEEDIATRSEALVDPPGAAPRAELVQLQTIEPAEFEVALRPWELLCRPTAGGSFRHEIEAIRGQDFVLYRERYALPFTLQGLTPPGMLAFAVHAAGPATPKCWDNAWNAQSLATAIGEPIDASIGAGHAQVMALISLDYLRRVLDAEMVEALESFAHHLLLDAVPGAAQRFEGWGHRVLDAALQNPDLLQQADYVPQLLSSLVDIIDAIYLPRLPDAGHIVKPRQRAVTLTIDYLRQRKPEPTPVSILSRVSGMSERSLQYAFHEEFGLSPTEFVKRWRLHAVRRHLVLGTADAKSVTQAALSCGFNELGRFAGEYEQLFGELPSITLRRHKRVADPA